MGRGISGGSVALRYVSVGGESCLFINFVSLLFCDSSSIDQLIQNHQIVLLA